MESLHAGDATPATLILQVPCRTATYEVLVAVSCAEIPATTTIRCIQVEGDVRRRWLC